MNSRLLFLVPLLLFVLSGVAAQSNSPQVIRDESSVTYRIVHPLHKIEATSKDVVYLLDIDAGSKTIRQVSARVDVTTFDSGNSNRDSHAMEAIDAMSFPEARFVSTAIRQTGDSLSIAGKLTLHGVTKDIVAAASVHWSQDRLQVAGSFDVTITAFNIERPSLLLIPVEDKLSFSFVAAFTLQ